MYHGDYLDFFFYEMFVMYSHIFCIRVLRYYVDVAVMLMYESLWLYYVMDSLLFHPMIILWDVIIDSI